MVKLMDGYSSVPGDYYSYDYDNAIGYTGRLEIYHDGQWGTVCDDGFNDLNAQVVCRSVIQSCEKMFTVEFSQNNFAEFSGKIVFKMKA